MSGLLATLFFGFISIMITNFFCLFFVHYFHSSRVDFDNLAYALAEYVCNIPYLLTSQDDGSPQGKPGLSEQ